MSPAPVMFTPAVTAAAHMQAPSVVHQLLPRQTAPPTTIRNPYMAYRDTKTKIVNSWMSDFSLVNATTDGTATSWTAVKSTKVGLDSTLLVTDRVTQLDWHLKQTLTFSDNREKTEYWDEANQCSLRTVSGTTDMACSKVMIRTVMDKTGTSTKTTSTAVMSDGPSTIILPGKAAAVATTASGNSTSSGSSSSASNTASASVSHTSGTTAAAAATTTAAKKSAAVPRTHRVLNSFAAYIAVGCLAVVTFSAAI